MRVIVTGSRKLGERYNDFIKKHKSFVNNQTIDIEQQDRKERLLFIKFLDRAVARAKELGHKEITFVHGDCPTGADKICRDYCWIYMHDQLTSDPIQIHEKRYPADWNRYNLKAGPIRNGEMVRSGADLVIAAWNGIAKGGTFDCMTQATLAGIPMWVIPYTGLGVV